MVFSYTKCYYCVKMIVRTVNVLEKIESPCINLAPDEEPTVERVCRGLNPDQGLITLFSENYVPVSVFLILLIWYTYFVSSNIEKCMTQIGCYLNVQ